MKKNKDKIPWENIIKHLTKQKDEKASKGLHDWLENRENQQKFDQLKALWDYCGNVKELYYAEENHNLEIKKKTKGLKTVLKLVLIFIIVLLIAVACYLWLS